MCTTCGCESLHSHAHGTDTDRAIAVEEDILSRNDAEARANRRLFGARGLFTLNLVSSPGSGKTTLLVESIRRLAGRAEAYFA